ncbi:MAG: ribonuclease HI family protein [bacterium]|nr:ribonuclease HI family protein [bacterium]
MPKKIIIHTDGGARGNPGPAGIGVVIRAPDKKIKKYSEYIGQATNNQAEYKALIFALKKAKALKPEKIQCYLDSELIVKQLNGAYKIKNKDLKPLFDQIITLSANFSKISFSHIPREKNKEADKLVNEALDRAGK